MMMCKCCNGANSHCNCMHHKVPMLGGLGLVVLGVVLFLTNYGWLDANVWQWLLPVAVVAAGVHCSMCCSIRRMDHCKSGSKCGGNCKCDNKTEGEMKQ